MSAIQPQQEAQTGAAMLTDSPELRTELRRFLEHGLMLDPWLAGLDQERFSFDSQELLGRAAEGLAAAHWQEPLVTATLGDLPAATPALGRKTAREVLDSTAATIASSRLGRIRVNVGIAREAVRRLERFVAEVGFGAAVHVYLLVETVKNQGALIHYREVGEDDFVHGRLHRPWLREPIGGELLRDIALGEMRVLVRDGRRIIATTPKGRRAWQKARQILAETGFLAERLALIQVSSFSSLEEYDHVLGSVIPLEIAWRRGLTEFMNVGPGQRVLDVGCGTGTQLFEGGVLAAVGPTGRVTALDSAAGMLDRARRKGEAGLAAPLDFVQGAAESLPFPDGAFDLTFDVSVLHLADTTRAISEMIRVTRPGGRVAHAGSCRLDQAAPAWLRWWLAPALRLARRYDLVAGNQSFASGEVAERFAEAGLQRVRVARQQNRSIFADLEEAAFFLLRSEPWIQRVLEVIPWGARRELIGEMVDRSRQVMARTDVSERTIPFPSEYVCGEVAGAAGRDPA